MRITPGFHVLIFRLWTKSVDQALLVPIPGAFEIFCGHMQNFPLITDDREFEEAVEGSGGSRSSLARLCVNHIKCVVKSVVISPGAYSMRSVVSLLQARCQVDECFRQILIDEGIVSALISVACRFSSPPFTAHECLVIAQKSAFKRCSRCQAMYCSTSCQIHDWRHGDHRKTCKWKAVGASYIPRALVEHFENLVYVHRYRRLLRSQYARPSVPPRTTPRRLLENEAHHFGR
ncbi:hypothetical protein K438DRAFT_1870113 [Mycena galopus ATCC 62051]|nr:hypothetical protein K438DRAFT_1870113 [Mycena galopus ATCC 62051]